MHRHCPHCNETVPSAGFKAHLRSHRTRVEIPRPVRRAVVARDGHLCTYPGCTRPGIEMAHLDWNPANNAEENLAMRCREHNPRGDEFSLDRSPAVGGRLA